MTRRWETEDVRLTDADGREWRVYDYSVYAGKAQRRLVSTGAQYRGFVPTDGGARRTYLMLGEEATRAPTPELLAAQLVKSNLYFRDDPAHAARIGRPVERADPPRESTPTMESGQTL